jgi:hypothetical protein
VLLILLATIRQGQTWDVFVLRCWLNDLPIFHPALTNPMELNPSWEAFSCAATQNFPTSYETRRFITVFTRVLHQFLSWGRPIQPISPHPI